MNPTPIVPVGIAPLPDASSASSVLPAIADAAQPAATSFSQLLNHGLDSIDTKIATADKMVRAFALDDSIPVHQVTYALDQAKMAMEMTLQVRTRLLDAYQQLMNMQL